MLWCTNCVQVSIVNRLSLIRSCWICFQNLIQAWILGFVLLLPYLTEIYFDLDLILTSQGDNRTKTLLPARNASPPSSDQPNKCSYPKPKFSYLLWVQQILVDVLFTPHNGLVLVGRRVSVAGSGPRRPPEQTMQIRSWPRRIRKKPKISSVAPAATKMFLLMSLSFLSFFGP